MIEALAQKNDLRLIKDESVAGSGRFSFQRNNRLVIKQSSLIKIIPFSDVVYLKSESNYTRVYTKDGKSTMASRTMKTFMPELSNEFIRVHQSYCINLLFLREYQKHNNLLRLADEILVPISRSKKKNFESLF